MQKFGEGVKERVIVQVPQEVVARLHKIGAAVDTSAAELRRTAAKSRAVRTFVSANDTCLKEAQKG